MITSTNAFAVVGIVTEETRAQRLGSIVAGVLPDYQYFGMANGKNTVQSVVQFDAHRRTVGLVLLDALLGGEACHRLARELSEQVPHVMVMAVAEADVESAADLVEDPLIHRYAASPWEGATFSYALKEAARFQRQEFQLNEKSRVLSELHRASMSLTGEPDLQQLLHKLMRIVIDNANAKHAYIILRDKDAQLSIQALGHSGDYTTQIDSLPISDFSPVCPGIVEYAYQNLENVILGDAVHEGLFSTNPYIRKNRCKSILCSPMVYQGNVLGLLYLENNEETDAFSATSLEFLKLLSATAAIAIQNARTYAELEGRVEERTRQIIAQKQELEHQRDKIQVINNDIMASIRYAKRIQEAFLPDLSEIRTAFPEAFVLYKPKDVVSGDFYWFSQRLSKTIIAAADCTGHGVPGAFMTVMANTLLKQIVELEGIFQPNEILAQLHLRVRVALRQGMESGDETDVDTQKDGLDIALCQVDVKRMKLQYAGANRPLVLIRKGVLEEFKADRYGIGGDVLESGSRTYTNHSIDLEPGDTVYFYSDGFEDQLGEEAGKRYSKKRLLQFLLDFQDKDLEHQALLLEAELQHWRGGLEQLDDVLVMGFRV